jgi:hypothetical protein
MIFSNQNTYLNINKRMNMSPLKAMSIRELEVHAKANNNHNQFKNR